jgi:hypothetical protein
MPHPNYPGGYGQNTRFPGSKHRAIHHGGEFRPHTPASGHPNYTPNKTRSALGAHSHANYPTSGSMKKGKKKGY